MKVSRRGEIIFTDSDKSSTGVTPSLRNCFDVFDHIDEAFFFFDEELRLVYVNKNGRELGRKAYGLQAGLNPKVVDFVPEERQHFIQKMLQQVIEEGRPADYEIEIPSSQLWLHCQYFPNYDENGLVNGAYGIVKDITAEKELSRLEKETEKIEQNLFASRLLFEQFMQNSPLVSWLTDAKGTMHYMNPIYQNTYEFTEDDFGKNIHELFETSIAIDYHFNNLRVIRSGKAIETIEKGLNATGELRTLRTYKFPLVVNNEQMVGGWAVDITDQVELQDRLIKSVEKHELVNEATSDAIYEWDSAHGAIHRSHRFEDLFGYTGNKVLPRHHLALIHPDDLSDFKQIVFAALRNKTIQKWQVEYRLRKANGNYRVVLDKAFIIRVNDQVTKVIGALQDITDQKKLQQKLVEQEKRSKQQIVKSIIDTQEKERRELSTELHDNVNQMLASCKLMLEVAKEGGTNAKTLTEKTYQTIQTVINEIRRISHDLNPAALVDVGLTDAIEQQIEKINLSGKINIRFVYGKPEHGFFLHENESIVIFRIVQEQLNNILKHSHASHVLINLDFADGQVRLAIKDDGVGFDLATIKKGLGLRNIYNRVEYYGGQITINTARGMGCETLITLNTKATAMDTAS